VGYVREELAKLVRTVTITSLRQEEIETVIRTRLHRLEGLTEKLLSGSKGSALKQGIR
jgi:hypothetical protein